MAGVMSPTEKAIIQKLEQIEDRVEKASKAPKGGLPNATFGFDQNWKSREWPHEKMKSLAGAYGSSGAVDMMCRPGGGQRKLLGIGSYLAKMAAVQFGGICPWYAELGRSMGLTGGYDSDALERETGLTTVTKAAKVGIKGFNGEVRKTALAENSGQTGGYVVPPQFMSELLTIAGEDAFIKPRARVLPMNSRTAEWPMLDITAVQAAGTTPYYGGILFKWQPEASTFAETEPAFKQSTWTAWDLVGYAVASNQLLADNGIGLDALLTQMFAGALTWYEEYAYLRGFGAGSQMPLGVLNAPATISQIRATSNRFVLQDAARMLAHLQVRSRANACWVMSQSVIPQLIQMVGGGTTDTVSTTNLPGNQLAWMDHLGGAAQRLPDTFLDGLPVFITEKLPQLGTSGDVMLCDFSNYVIGQRLDIQIDVSPHVNFLTNQLTWRVVFRGDGKPWLNSYITQADASWQVSPFVYLNSATS